MRIPLELERCTLPWMSRAILLCALSIPLLGCDGADEILNHNSYDHCKADCVVFSEAVSDNSISEDQFGKSPDWFELHNYGKTELRLDGWSVSDDAEEPDKWVFPAETLLPVDGYLLIWASNNEVAKNEKVLNGEYHANFKISQDGETLYLFNPKGKKVDTFTVEGLRTGTSIGRTTKGDTVYYATTTPGAANVKESYKGVLLHAVEFSSDGGKLAPASLSLSGAETNEVIRYTLDGRIPTGSDSVYETPIVIASNTVVRAALFKPDYIPSVTTSRTFLPEAQHDLPIVTLVTEPKNFFDIDTGIYVLGTDYEPEEPYYGANYWQDWERDIQFAFYEEDGDLGVMLDAGVKIYGGYTRFMSQKSLAIYARDRYGYNEIKYPFFANRDYDEFQAIVLRNSGNDWLQSMLRDAALTSLMEGTEVDYQAYRPASVYLNGEYWGMHNIREKINEHYIASLHGVNADSVDLIDSYGTELHGSNVDFLQLYDFIDKNDLSDPDNYAVVEAAFDIENYISYNVAEIYLNNGDWPSNNMKIWRTPDSKWRWIMYDTDFGFAIWDEADVMFNTLAFALDDNGPEWPNPPWSTLILRKLVENQDFRLQFINRFADYFNTRFKAEKVQAHIDAMASVIASEMPRHFERWKEDVWADWDSEISHMKSFAEYRVGYLAEHIINEFGLSGYFPLTVTLNSDAGEVQVNSLTVAEAEWQGKYFGDIPLHLTAVPKPGFVFSHWTGAIDSIEANISLTLNAAASVNAVFIEAP